MDEATPLKQKLGDVSEESRTKETSSSHDTLDAVPEIVDEIREEEEEQEKEDVMISQNLFDGSSEDEEEGEATPLKNFDDVFEDLQTKEATILENTALDVESEIEDETRVEENIQPLRRSTRERKPNKICHHCVAYAHQY